MTPLVVITRPESQGRAWAGALEAQGWLTVLLPLIETSPPKDLRALGAAQAHWRDFDAVMFVSSQAVAHFFADGPPFPTEANVPRCWCPGPGTAQALLQHGIPAAKIDAPRLDSEQFDSEALWQVVAAQVRPGHRLLLIRGDGGRNWLARQCAAQGGQVEVCSAYERRVPVWSMLQRQQAQAAAGRDAVWLLTSSEGVGNLRHLLPDTDWGQTTALVTHPRIAAAAQQMGFGRVVESHPAIQAVLQTLKSMH